ncbi:P-loop NTPase fold protein [Oribacterium sinus]
MKSDNQEVLGIEERKEKEAKLEELYRQVDAMEGNWGNAERDEFTSDYEDEPVPPWEENDFEIRKCYNEIEKIENELHADDYNKKRSNLLKKQIYNNSFYFRGNVLNDYLPIKDLLDREVKASEIASIICSDLSSNSFNVGVIGEWGSGKSTFIEYIKKFVKKNKKSEELIVLSYDASSYSDQNQIWANFSKLLFEEYEQKALLPRIRYQLAKFNKNKKHYISQLLLNLVIIAITFGIMYGTKILFSYKGFLAEFAGYGLSIGGILLFTTQIIIPSTQKLLSISIPLSHRISDKIKLPSYIEILGTRERILKELDILFEAWIPKSNKKIIIFVDELDRCSSKGISEFFQSIQLFAPTKKIIFVFAIELLHLKTALLKMHEISAREIDSFTRQYLDKYVSIVIPLNNDFSYSKLAEQLICDVNASDSANNNKKICITNEEIEIIRKCIDILPYNMLTPRRVKKLVNLLIVTKDYCINYNSDFPINYSQLFSWIILNLFYHEVAEYIANLYTKQKKHWIIEDIVNDQMRLALQKKLSGTPYLEIIDDFVMLDIIVYNGIANEFSIFVY